MPVLKSICDVTKQVMDVHLMVQEPIRYVEEFAKSGADIITIHMEACEDIEATIRAIKDCGKKVGLSICPETPTEVLLPVLEKADMILVMSVHPGFGGQKFIPESLEKIRTVRKMLDERGLQTDIEVDGGIYTSNVEEVLEAGANVIVAGSAIFVGNPAQNTQAMMEILNRYE